MFLLVGLIMSLYVLLVLVRDLLCWSPTQEDASRVLFEGLLSATPVLLMRGGVACCFSVAVDNSTCRWKSACPYRALFLMSCRGEVAVLGLGRDDGMGGSVQVQVVHDVKDGPGNPGRLKDWCDLCS